MRKFLIKGIEHPHVKAYLNFMIDVAVMFGANRSRAEKELFDALQFEIELAKVLIDTLFFLIFFQFRCNFPKLFRLPDPSGVTIQSIYNKKASNNISIFELV